MSGKLKSFFSATIGAGDELKAFVSASDNGLITSTVAGGKTSLDVNIAASDIAIEVDLDHTTDSVKIGDGTDFLAVNADGSINAVVTATNLDIRDLAFATDKVDVSGSSVSISGDVNVTQGTSPWVVSATDLDIRNLTFATDTVDVSGSSVTVSATNLDIRDLAAATDSVSAWTKDGAGNSIDSLGSALRVTDHADTIVAAAPVISNTATAIAAAATQTKIMLQNLGGVKIYVGDSGVTSGTGWEVDKNEFLELPFSGTLYAITAAGSTAAGDIRVLKLSA